MYIIKMEIQKTTGWKILRLLAQKNTAPSILLLNGRATLFAVLLVELQKNGICRMVYVLHVTNGPIHQKNKLLVDGIICSTNELLA